MIGSWNRFGRSLGALLLFTGALASCTFKAGTTNPGGSGGGSGGRGGGTGGAGTGGSGPAIPGLTMLRVEPATADVSVSPGMPASQQFRAIGIMTGGREEDVTARVAWSVDRVNLVPSVAGGLATTTDKTGGTALVKAASGTLASTGTLRIKFSAVNIADGAGANPPIPASPGNTFGGANDAARAPELVYPNAGVLLPPNLNGVEVHFRAGSGMNTLFEIAFANAVTDVKVYTRCVTLQDGCVYKPTPAVWSQIAETNRGTGPVTVTVRGTDDGGTAVGKSASIDLVFSKEDIRGGLYYWSTTLRSILRWDFTAAVQDNTPVVSPADGDGSTCVGCHALSRDGTKMVSTLGGQNDGRILLWDVGRKVAMAKPFTMQKSQFESWNPDGSVFVGMYTDDTKTGPSNLILFDGTTGLRTGMIDLGGLRADHPDWSPDGNRIVFTSVDTTGRYTDQKPQKSGLAYIDKMGTGWSAPVTLLPRVAGKNRYYPAIAPTNSFIIFNESSCASGDTGNDCDADTDPRAMLWTMPVPVTATATPTLLGAANAPGVNDKGNTALTNTYPKWSPFVFQLNEHNQVLWATFSSKRRYGLYPDTGNLYIWMFAMNPGVGAGSDPSYSAFAIPFQALDSSNHIAQWTTQVVPIIP
jgi:hypothetical protein